MSNFYDKSKSCTHILNRTLICVSRIILKACLTRIFYEIKNSIKGYYLFFIGKS